MIRPRVIRTQEEWFVLSRYKQVAGPGRPLDYLLYKFGPPEYLSNLRIYSNGSVQYFVRGQGRPLPPRTRLYFINESKVFNSLQEAIDSTDSGVR